jgi:hypothetical protein
VRSEAREKGGEEEESERAVETKTQATGVSQFPSFVGFETPFSVSFSRSPSSQLATHAMSSSADRINLGELTSQLANAEARVCEWASAAGKRADAARLEHGRRIAALRGKKKAMGSEGGGALACFELCLLWEGWW